MKIPYPSRNELLVRRVDTRAYPESFFESIYSQEKTAFLYESLENDGERGRYSFVGARPFITFVSRGRSIVIEAEEKRHELSGDPMHILREIMSQCEFPLSHRVFTGGAVGFVSYDAIRYYEGIPDENSDELGVPDMHFIFPSEIVIFDHVKQSADIIMYSSDCEERLTEIIEALQQPYEELPEEEGKEPCPEFESNFSRTEFCAAVEKAREYILAGDIFQVVLSQRFSFPLKRDPLAVYRRLRETNPSPYMYYLRFDGLAVLGSSPETLVKCVGGEVITRPLAGTRRRGKDEAEDRALEQELLSDEKERAEHVMLVDLARNDIGRVCEYGSIRPDELFGIERYSRVMHIVSNVRGRLAPEKDMFEVFGAAFPAGTVSGAPKVRAMEIIDELETTRRGVYAGAIGYFDFCGNMDVCITIRTIVIKDGIGYIQAGAGIVADSDPELEYKETLNKARALFATIEGMS